MVFEWLDIDVFEGVQGMLLVCVMNGVGIFECVFYVEMFFLCLSYGWGEFWVFFFGDFKYIYGFWFEFYDLSCDLKEFMDLVVECFEDVVVMCMNLIVYFEREVVVGVDVLVVFDQDMVC